MATRKTPERMTKDSSSELWLATLSRPIESLKLPPFFGQVAKPWSPQGLGSRLASDKPPSTAGDGAASQTGVCRCGALSDSAGQCSGENLLQR